MLFQRVVNFVEDLVHLVIDVLWHELLLLFLLQLIFILDQLLLLLLRLLLLQLVFTLVEVWKGLLFLVLADGVTFLQGL